MAIPGTPLVTTIPVGYTPHNQLHIDENTAINYIAASAAAGLFLATPSAAPGVKDFRAITGADITAALRAIPDGTVGAPALAFASNTDTGIYLTSPGKVCIASEGADILRVSLFGGTVHVFEVGDGTGSAQMNFQAAAGTDRAIFFYSGATSRWKLYVNSTAEGGSNAGSDFALDSRTDAGAALISNIITAQRTTGNVGFGITPASILAHVHNRGIADIIQQIVQGFSTQTSDLQQWRNNAATPLVSISGAGLFFPVQFTTGGTPAWAAGLKGAVIYDTTLQKLRVAGNAAWETVTSV